MRFRSVVASVGACAVILAGCDGSGKSAAGPSGSRSPSPATQPMPAVGACYAEVTQVSTASDRPTDCAKPHKTETVSVGTFAEEYANTPTLPWSVSPAMHWAFHACDVDSQRFVGGDWRGGRLSVQVVTPSPQAWAAGSHWYRCDIFELTATHLDNAQERTGSLRDALTHKLPLVHTCFNQNKSEDLVPVACTKPHHFEFVGIWTAPDTDRGKLSDDSERIWRECRAVIAYFIGVPKKTNMEHEAGVSYQIPSAGAWGRGDRGVRCFLWSEKRKLTRSLKDTGFDLLPI